MHKIVPGDFMTIGVFAHIFVEVGAGP